MRIAIRCASKTHGLVASHLDRPTLPTAVDVLSPVDGADFAELSGLDALLATAARNSPASVLMGDDAGLSTAADLARNVRRLAEQFRLAGLARGERVLIVAGATVASFVATVAVLRAGLEPALARCGLGPIDIAAHARAADAVAIVGPSAYGEEIGEAYLSAAALADGVRLIATQGPDPIDGAVDVSFAALDHAPDPSLASGEAPLEMPSIATFAGPPGAPALVSHRQAGLFADALSLVEQAHVNPTRPILSLLPISSRAGLVAGPFAALVGASRLLMHGPFGSARFLALCDAHPHAHLVAPADLGPVFGGPAFAASLETLVLVSRFAEPPAFELPERIDGRVPVTDLYAFGEESVLAQHRRDGEARPPGRVADHSLADGLGARLNRARAGHRMHAADGG